MVFFFCLRWDKDVDFKTFRELRWQQELSIMDQLYHCNHLQFVALLQASTVVHMKLDFFNFTCSCLMHTGEITFTTILSFFACLVFSCNHAHTFSGNCVID
jgi:hypothetical protein